MRQIEIAGQSVPALGQGTWRMGEDRAKAAEEAKAINVGIDAGMSVIDTAEMYGQGGAELMLADALKGRRDEIYLVSKAYPQNASRKRLPAACEASLKRLGTDRLDLYLLHWPGSVPIAETVEAMEALVEAGKIRAWGVSNFDVSDMAGLISAGGAPCATNQVLYNITCRAPEYDLAPWLATHGMPMMAYSPVQQGNLPTGGALAEVAARHEVSIHQAALAWVLARGTLAIPKATSLAHVRANRAAAELVLSADDHATLDAAFPPPKRKRRLAML